MLEEPLSFSVDGCLGQACDAGKPAGEPAVMGEPAADGEPEAEPVGGAEPACAVTLDAGAD